MAEPDPYADLLEEDPYADLLADATTPSPTPLRDKVLVPRTLLGSVLEALPVPWSSSGLLEPAVEKVGKPKVGGGETFLNKAVNALPAGNVATDAGTAGSLLLAEKAGRIAPDAARTLSGLAGRFLPEALQLSPVPGPGAVLTPQAKKELEALGEVVAEPEDPGFLSTYRKARDTRRARTTAGEEQNPLSALAGTGTGVGLSMLAPLPKATPKGGAEAGLLSRMAAGGKTGLGYGALAGLTSGEADTAGGDLAGTAAETLAGGLLGGALGAAFPVVGALGSWLLRGVVKPTPAARALQEEGVDNLTLGQMDPKSALGSLESASQSVAGAGPAITAQREAAHDAFRIAAANAVKPPGMDDLPKGTTVPEAIGKLQDKFDEIYGSIRNVKVPTLPADRLLLRISTPEAQFEALATDDAVTQAAKFIRQQMSILPKEGTETTAGVLMKIRHNIRQKIRGLSGGNEEKQKEVARLLSMAEEELTEGLEASLPDDAAKLLAATDRQYGKYKVLEDAVIRAKDPASGKGSFTPQRLDTSVATAMKERGYAPEFARGGGGQLRDLAANAAQAFEDVKGTGYGAQLAGAAPFKYVTAPAIAFANREGVKPLLLGQAPIQRAMQSRADDLQPLLDLLNPPQTFLPQALAEALRDRKDVP